MANVMAGMGAEEKEHNGTRKEGQDYTHTHRMPGRAGSTKNVKRRMNSEKTRG